MKPSPTILALTLTVFITGESLAQGDLFVFPKEGQSNEQMEKDKAECHYMAGQQTGYGMTAPAPSSSAGSGSAGGEVVRGAAKGAAWGAVIGEVAGDSAGKGAAWGAAAGAVRGGRQRRKAEKQQEDAVKQAEQEQAAVYENYKRAMTGCLDARGYSVQ